MNRSTEMSVTIANSLATGSLLSDQQLECAYRHYKALYETMAFSGPQFSEARMAAQIWGSKARERLIASRRDAAARRSADTFETDIEEIR